MFGKGVFQEEENLLRNIIRSIDKRVDYSAKEGEGSRFTVHIKLRAHEDDVVLDLEDLKAAKTDTVKRHQIRGVPKLDRPIDRLDRNRRGKGRRHGLPPFWKFRRQ